MKGILNNSRIKAKLNLLSLLMGLVIIGSGTSAFAQGNFLGPYRNDPGALPVPLVSPRYPELSLTGSMSSYDDEWYPDADLIVPLNLPSRDGTVINNNRILMPVFIRNFNWGNEFDLHPGDSIIEFPATPITSYKFSILYNGAVLNPVGVQTYHPKDFIDQGLVEADEQPISNNWNVSFNVQETEKYREFLILNPDTKDREKGAKVTITGVSPNLPIPTSPAATSVLVYVVFEVLHTEASIEQQDREFPIYIENEEIFYNDIDVTKDAPFRDFERYLDSVNATLRYDNLYRNPDIYWPEEPYTYWNVTWPNRPELPYLGGMSNFSANTNETTPILPGVIYASARDYANLSFVNQEARDGEQIELVASEEYLSKEIGIEYNLVDPLTQSICVPTTEGNRRSVKLELIDNGTRVDRLRIQSDQPWLGVVSNPNSSLQFIPQLETDVVVRYVDNGTLINDVSNNNTPLNQPPTAPSGDVVIDVVANVTEGLEPGIHTGYLTFSSPYLINSPVKLRVTFIYFDDAEEGLNNGDNCGGIELIVENSNNPVQRTTLLFGTHERATNGVDTLFGERAASTVIGQDNNGFGARFFPKTLDNNSGTISLRDADGNILMDQLQRGFGDWNPYDLDARAESRDYRSNINTEESIIYWVEFDENGDNNYPVVVSWDTQDFLENATLFIRDTENGQLFPSVNMRQANPTGGTRRSFTIQDQRVNSFLIEYTLPDVFEYVDANGDPLIKTGWNFLSLPVRPTNSEWRNVYTKASGVPTYYAPSFYAQEDILTAGRGYFVKYLTGSDNVDKTFAGTVISEVSNDLGDQATVFAKENGEGGWNTVGALSRPTCTKGISFDIFPGESSAPTVDYTQKFGVYEYVNNEGYREVSELLPGLGYWIKVDKIGYYRLSQQNCKTTPSDFNNKQDIYRNSDVVEIFDNNNAKGKVYFNVNTEIETEVFELPPAPFNEIFDVRFADNKSLSNVASNVINVQGVQFPIHIEVDNATMKYEFKDAVTGRILGSIAEGTSDVVTIESLASNSIVVETQNINTGSKVYPSIVNNKFTVEYNNEVSGMVNVDIYDLLGNKIANVVSKEQNAGNFTYEVTNDTVNKMNAGRYIVRISTPTGENSELITVVK